MKSAFFLVSLLISRTLFADDIIEMKTRVRWRVKNCLVKNGHLHITPCYSSNECKDSLDANQFSCIPSKSCNFSQLLSSHYSGFEITGYSQNSNAIGSITINSSKKFDIIPPDKTTKEISDSTLIFDEKNKTRAPLKTLDSMAIDQRQIETINSAITECPHPRTQP